MTVPLVRLGDDPSTLAAAWLAVDPDPELRVELDGLLTSAPEDVERLFSGRLAFGTAGLRGALGLGPRRMNRVLVRVVAAALASVLDSASPRHVVVGFDARHGSRDFADDTARVLASRGVKVTLFEDVVPTPVLAFSVRHLDASAGAMVTASHNPRHDNGYKVYWQDGAQLGSPIDQQVSDAIDAQPLLAEDDLVSLDSPLIQPAGESARRAYLDAVGALVDRDEVASRTAGNRASVVYSPLHGVGGSTLLDAFEAGGFVRPRVVSSQADPDPDFPTAPFPNPEETGVLDDLLALAEESGADVALVNDPDADRLAVAVPGHSGWRLLTGDELGSVLAEHLLEQSVDLGPARLVANTVVSSRLLARMAQHHRVTYAETLTGFKWIMQAGTEHPGLAPILGYEEALGYSVGSVVRDKDGIGAALVVVDLAERLKAEGRTLLDLLDDLHRQHGVHVTGQRSIRFESTGDEDSVMGDAMRSLRTKPPQSLGGQEVTNIVDLVDGWQHLPATDAVILETDNGRAVVRPSGTEPKMKVYGEVMLPPDSEVARRRLEARVRLMDLLDEAVRWAAGAPLSSSVEQADLREVGNDPQSVTDLRSMVQALTLALPESDTSAGAVRALCALARRPDPADPTVGPVAAVSVPPELADLAAQLLAGSSIGIETTTEFEATPATESGSLHAVLARLWSAR